MKRKAEQLKLTERLPAELPTSRIRGGVTRWIREDLDSAAAHAKLGERLKCDHDLLFKIVDFSRSKKADRMRRVLAPYFDAGAPMPLTLVTLEALISKFPHLREVLESKYSVVGSSELTSPVPVQ